MECVFPPTPPLVKQHALNVPRASILAQSIFSPLYKAEAGRLCSYMQPRAANTFVHSKYALHLCEQPPIHHLPHPAAVRYCESQNLHLLLTVHSEPVSLQETVIIAFHLQEDKHIKLLERFR